MKEEKMSRREFGKKLLKMVGVSSISPVLFPKVSTGEAEPPKKESSREGKKGTWEVKKGDSYINFNCPNEQGLSKEQIQKFSEFVNEILERARKKNYDVVFSLNGFASAEKEAWDTGGSVNDFDAKLARERLASLKEVVERLKLNFPDVEVSIDDDVYATPDTLRGASATAFYSVGKEMFEDLKRDVSEIKDIIEKQRRPETNKEEFRALEKRLDEILSKYEQLEKGLRINSKWVKAAIVGSTLALVMGLIAFLKKDNVTIGHPRGEGDAPPPGGK